MFKKKLIFKIYLHMITTACFSFFILDTTNAKKSRYSQFLLKKTKNKNKNKSWLFPRKPDLENKIFKIKKINK